MSDLATLPLAGMPSPGQSRSFHRFPKLPPELRLHIWRFCLPRRLVELEPGCTSPNSGRRTRGKRVQSRPPAISAVCFEARLVALEHGGFRLFNCSANFASLGWFDTSRDTLLARHPYMEPHHVQTAWREAEKLKARPISLDEVKSVAIDAGALADCSDTFQGVEKLRNWLCTRDELFWVGTRMFTGDLFGSGYFESSGARLLFGGRDEQSCSLAVLAGSGGLSEPIECPVDRKWLNDCWVFIHRHDHEFQRDLHTLPDDDSWSDYVMSLKPPGTPICILMNCGPRHRQRGLIYKSDLERAEVWADTFIECNPEDCKCGYHI